MVTKGATDGFDWLGIATPAGTEVQAYVRVPTPGAAPIVTMVPAQIP